MEYHVHPLRNGIRLLHVPAVSSIAHACILIPAGSRDESERQWGIAHFIEHLIFKRTEKRNTQQILNRLESVGADLNAYTTKEYTCIHASFLQPYLDRTLELFQDIVFHSTFPLSEMEKEKAVILDEMASYLDQPEEAIADDFEDMLFKEHALGRNILGSPESLTAITPADIRDFLQQNYRTDQIIVAVLGQYPLKKVQYIAERYFDAIPENSPARQRCAPVGYVPEQRQVEKPIMQAHTMLGMPAYSLHHPYKTGLLLLNNLLGGSGMSAILNMQIREKHGIAYTIESNYSPLTDTGIFAVYFGTDKEKTERTLRLVEKEFKKIREQRMSVLQLHKAQNRFIGQIALGEENRIGLLIGMAKSLLDYQQIDDLETVFKKIRAVTAEEILSLANTVLDEKQRSVLSFIPAKTAE